MKDWFLAVRPQTLIISLAPILLSQGLAYHALELSSAPFHFSLAALALACAVCLQIAVNLANDYYDCLSGVDHVLRKGPARIDGRGAISLGQLRRVFLGFLALGVVLGVSLALLVNPLLIAVGVLCVLAVLAYSAGPWPLAYNAMGELIVFWVFGPIAVFGGYSLHMPTGLLGSDTLPGLSSMATHFFDSMPLSLWYPAVAMGSLAAAVMLVNNIRDRESDQLAAKRTLAGLLGDRPSRSLYIALIILAAVMVNLVETSVESFWQWRYTVLPAAAYLVLGIVRREGRALNTQLGQTAVFMLLAALATVMDVLRT